MSSQASGRRRHHCDDPSKCHYCRRTSAQLTAGRCYACDNPLDPHSRRYCTHHLNEHGGMARAYKERHSELGLCQCCPNPSIPGQTRCERCRSRDGESRRRRRERERGKEKEKEENQSRQTAGVGIESRAHDSGATHGNHMSQPAHPSRQRRRHRPSHTPGETSNRAYSGPSTGTVRQRSSRHVQSANQYQLQGSDHYGTMGDAHHNVQSEAQDEADDDRVYANVLLLRDYCMYNP
ncbi:hypothetical protein F4776DRAFT_676600 [Hypoxylon sp. NC0597]|nr:hypothetical protein F4776DRAFT_676600 [Hypoxylon sp. NC0597]